VPAPPPRTVPAILRARGRSRPRGPQPARRAPITTNLGDGQVRLREPGGDQGPTRRCWPWWV
jgi:hypothetical protein